MDKVDTKRITIRQIAKNTAKKLIVENHYSHSWTHCRYALGIYYDDPDEHEWFSDNKRLIGCVVFGHPIGYCTMASISKLCDYENTLELTRLWIADGHGKNIESFVIGQSFRWLRENATQVKVLVSYADPAEGHLGIIYQATNWMYQGKIKGRSLDGITHIDKYISTDKVTWTHPRSFATVYGDTELTTIVNALGTPVYRKSLAVKHRYLYFLGNKRERKSFLASLRYPILKSYPTSTSFNLTIERLDLVDGKIVVTQESALIKTNEK